MTSNDYCYYGYSCFCGDGVPNKFIPRRSPSSFSSWAYSCSSCSPPPMSRRSPIKSSSPCSLSS